MKHLYIGITDSDLFRLSEYLYEHNYSNAILGLTLSFGTFSCEVRETSENIYNLVGSKNERKEK